MKFTLEIDTPSLESLEDELEHVLNNLRNNRTFDRKRTVNHCTSTISTSGNLYPYALAKWDKEGENIIEVLSYHSTEKEANAAYRAQNDPDVEVCDICVRYTTSYQ